MGDFSNQMASSGLTAALIGLIYAGIRIMKRSSCHSDSKCCKFDISRDEEIERKRTERDELVEIIVERLQRVNPEPRGETAI